MLKYVPISNNNAVRDCVTATKDTEIINMEMKIVIDFMLLKK